MVTRRVFLPGVLSAAAVGLLFLAGCSFLERGQPKPAAPPTVTETVVTAQPSLPAVATPKSPTLPAAADGSPTAIVGRAHQVDPADYQQMAWGTNMAMRHTPGEYAFQTPSGNIGCIWRTEADTRLVCYLATRYTNPAPRPASCPENAGPGWSTDHVVLTAAGAEDGICTGGLQVPPVAKVLPYGSALTAADYGCVSEEAGITCVHQPSGRGFFVSRERFATY